MSHPEIACLIAAVPLALATGALWGFAWGWEYGERRARKPVDEDEAVRHWRGDQSAPEDSSLPRDVLVLVAEQGRRPIIDPWARPRFDLRQPDDPAPRRLGEPL